MKGEFEKINLFSCPIYKTRIDPNSYDKEKILNDIKYNKNLKNTRQENSEWSKEICDIHHSYKDNENEDFRSINYDKLISVYEQFFTEFFDKELFTKRNFEFKLEIVNYSAITEGQYLPSHHHGETDDFAVVHYLNFKDDHTPTLFHNPSTFSPFLKHLRPELFNILDNTISDNSYIWENFRFPVKEDDMLIFPSILNHEIKPQGPTKEPRITVATNVSIFLPPEDRDARVVGSFRKKL